MQALLAMWADASIQRQLLGAVWNTTAFNKIADELVRKGYQRNTKQCREVEAAEENARKLHQGKYDSLASSKSVVALAESLLEKTYTFAKCAARLLLVPSFDR